MLVLHAGAEQVSLSKRVQQHLDGEKCDYNCSICAQKAAKRAFAAKQAEDRSKGGRSPAPSKKDRGGGPQRNVHLKDGTYDPGPETVTKKEYDERG